jgi:hypothetical protein
MILRLFKGAQPALFAFVPVFAVLLWLKYLLIPQPEIIAFEPHPMPLYEAVASWLAEFKLVSNLLTLLLLIVIALWLSRLNTRFIIIGSRTYLHAFIFLITVSAYLPLQQFNPAIPACFFLVYCMESMFETFKKEKLAHQFFLAGFLVSVASLFYARSAYMLFIVWTGLGILRAFNWREWAFTVLGFIIPYVFLFSFYHLTGQNLQENWILIMENILPDRQMALPGQHTMIFYAYVLLLLVFAGTGMLRLNQGLKIYIRTFYSLNIWMLIITLLVWSLFYSRSIEFVYFLAVPVSYILTPFLFNLRSRLMGDILFGILISLYGLILIYN